MSVLRRLLLPLVTVVILILQLTVFSSLQIHGAQPDIMLLLPILVAIRRGPQRGAVVGFAVGLLVDLFLRTPFGLSALTFTIVGYTVGLVQGAVIRPATWLTAAIAAVASGGGTILYAVLDAIMGNPSALHVNLLAVVVVVAAVNGVLALPGAWVFRWVEPGPAREAAPSVGGIAGPASSRWGAGVGR